MMSHREVSNCHMYAEPESLLKYRNGMFWPVLGGTLSDPLTKKMVLVLFLNQSVDYAHGSNSNNIIVNRR